MGHGNAIVLTMQVEAHGLDERGKGARSEEGEGEGEGCLGRRDKG